MIEQFHHSSIVSALSDPSGGFSLATGIGWFIAFINSGSKRLVEVTIFEAKLITGLGGMDRTYKEKAIMAATTRPPAHGSSLKHACREKIC
jgi:hypothetical protein